MNQQLHNYSTQIKTKTVEYESLQSSVNELQEKYTPIETEFKTKTEIKNSLNKENQELFLKYANVMEDFDKIKDVFQQASQTHLKLSTENSKSVSLLLELRSREAELQNSRLFEHPVQKKNTPKLNKSETKQFFAPLPFITGDQKESSGDFDSPSIASMIFQDFKEIKGDIKHQRAVSCLAIANSNPYLASGSQDSTIFLIKTDIAQREKILTPGRKGSIMCLQFSPTDQLLLSGSYESSIFLYSLSNYRLVHTFNENRKCVNDVCFLSDEKFASSSSDQRIIIFDIAQTRQSQVMICSSSPYSICTRFGDSLIFTGHHDGKIRGWDIRESSYPIEIDAHKKKIIQVSLVGNSDLQFATLSADNTIAVFDWRTRTRMGSINVKETRFPSDQFR